MKKLRFLCLAAFVLLPLLLSAQEISVNEARFHPGDNPDWAAPALDDSAWGTLTLDKEWDYQGVSHSNDFAWYRIHVVIPSAIRKSLAFPGRVLIDLGCIDDCDETWLNGHRIGKTGTFPEDAAGYKTKYDIPRRYLVPVDLIKWDQENVIAVRVYNGDNPGGFYEGPARIKAPALSDYAAFTVTEEGGRCKVLFTSDVKTHGTLRVEASDIYTEKADAPVSYKVKLSPGKPTEVSFPVADAKHLMITYVDKTSGEKLQAVHNTRYILTPPAPATPRYNGPAVFGVRPGSPVIFRLAFSGDKPMKYAVEGLPEGVVLDPEKGVLSGSCAKAGEYPLVFTATNDKGSARAKFTLVVGEDKIGLTPPMGWNSWNCWGLTVSQEKVMSSAAALINRGLADYGYAYMNIDDAWESEERLPDGRITGNEKFPDMKGLGDWLHSNGLKFGIYSGPGDKTCGGYPASLDHERQDAEVWNEWGVDYLKYDWCSYRNVFQAGRDKSEAAYMRPYLKMQQYLREQPRDIFYSLCQFGWGNAIEWGIFVDANSWRTAHDIQDTWESLYETGFVRQKGLHPYSGPGHWNDPDMLVVGKVGWSDNLHDSRLTPDEQYTHISLWSLLASNLLIGCDLSQIDDFTFNLLCNNEVNAVNQDVLGHQAHQDVDEDGMQIWSRDLADGSHAVGIFNLNDAPVPVRLDGALAKIGLKAGSVRDLWRQKDITADAEYVIPTHGVLYVKVRKMTGPGSIIPAPAEYSVLPGSVRVDGWTQSPTVRVSESALRQRLEGRELADWQLKSAYWMEIGKEGVKIEAADPEGVFYARQSLRMLASLDSVVTCCTILDWPRFRHRGLMLDESRNFQGKEFVLKQLEMMALLKMNRFHFHLVDNPGWRLQIDAYPRLTQLTAWRPEPDFWDWEKDEIGGDFLEEGTPGAYGGYYSKQDIAEILAFAAERHIEVIPEIEMPGHNYETRAAYPELACSLPSAEMHDKWELCPGKESTFEFLEKVLLEVFELFPSEYVHIGGDEAGKKNWERCPDCQARMKAEGLESVEQLQSYLIKRIESFAHEHGKRIIGWDEILQGGLAPDATVMSWRGTAGGLRAIAEGHDVIFTPTHYCYLDYHQDPKQYRPAGRYLPLEKVYSFDPMEESISKADAHHVLGLQGNLWTEWVHEAWHAEMMLYPRAFAIAETGWSPAARKDYPDFERRASAFAAVARAMGYTVYAVFPHF